METDNKWEAGSDYLLLSFPNERVHNIVLPFIPKALQHVTTLLKVKLLYASAVKCHCSYTASVGGSICNSTVESEAVA